MSKCIDCLSEKVCKYNGVINLYCKNDYVCPYFKDSSEWVHLPNEEFTFTVRGDIALGIIIANCRAAEEAKEKIRVDEDT